jgi:hypothetical protein
MEQTSSIYEVTVEAKLPEFDTERLFVANEKKYAHGELERLENRPAALKAARVVLGVPKPKDWKQYIHALDHYWVKMHEHMEEIADGLVPLKFFVVNNGPDLDETINIKVHVENGTIHPAKQAPRRPARIDGPQHVPDWSPRAPLVGGFSRRGIRITPHTVEATFSQLEAQDSADLVHQILYVQGDDKTRFSYEITSKRLGVTERGEVDFM